MKLLIVEDDENKRHQLSELIQEKFPNVSVDMARSLQSGLRTIIKVKYDLIILDMTMPTYDISVDEDGGRPRAYAGREILRQMERRKIFVPVILVTQFDRFGEGSESITLSEIDAQLFSEHKVNYRGSVFYNPALEEWKTSLFKIINRLMEDE